MEDQRREKDNPFQPISLDERLSRPVPKTRHTAHEPMMMRPGQLYGRTPFYQPAVMGSPAPTEPASPQTIPFSSFQPFGSVNAVVFKKGEIIYSDKLPQVVDRFIADASEMMKRK